MKPNWDYWTPDWANFLALDSNGIWNWWELKPHVCGSEWLVRVFHGLLQVQEAGFSGSFINNPTWKESLEERPAA